MNSTKIIALMTVIVACFGCFALFSEESDAASDETCTVTFVTEFQISDPEIEQVTVTKGGFLHDVPGTPGVTTDSGHLFLGWYLDKGCKTLFSQNVKINSNTTLYAKWTNIESEYTLSLYDVSAFGMILYNTITVEKNTKASEPSSPSRDGLKFAGWYYYEGVDAETGEPVYTEFDWSEAVNNNYTLYAVWEEKGLMDSLSTLALTCVFIFLAVLALIAVVYFQSRKAIVLVVLFIALAIATHLGALQEILTALDSFLHSRG